MRLKKIDEETRAHVFNEWKEESTALNESVNDLLKSIYYVKEKFVNSKTVE